MNEIIPMLQQGLVTILGALITLGAAYAVRAISTYTVKLQAEASDIKNAEQYELVANAIALAQELAVTTVTAIEQTTAKTLREAVKAGTADSGEMEDLAQDALRTIESQLSPVYKQAITDVYGDLEGYLKNLIEQKVWELKNLSSPQGV